METYQDLEFKEESSYLYDWVLHFNPYTNLWAAIPKNVYIEYWNKNDHPNVLRSNKLETLLEILYKSKGNVDVINNTIIKA
jgi:hypothetical protein